MPHYRHDINPPGVYYYRSASITYADSSVELGLIPSGATIVATIVNVSEAFNAGTTNVLTVGYGASFDELVAAADVNESSATKQAVFKSLTLTADKTVYIKYAYTGTAPTTGEATVTVIFSL